ncbi:MAG: anti-phage dCTP deaminase [Methylobacter sp.]
MIPHLKSTIDSIYNKDSDFIVLGLTGRTGSGCSTAADILQKTSNEISNSLFNGDKPENNEERKEKIILSFFKKNWHPFQLLKVRSIITLMLAESDINDAVELLSSIIPEIDKGKTGAVLKQIADNYSEIQKNSTPEKKIEFYTKNLSELCNNFRELLPATKIVELYQKIGKNIRASGSPLNGNSEEGKFFSLAEKINSVIKELKDANKACRKSTFLVIDAIRNPLEALYFQDRYAAFYLVAISCCNRQRIARLHDIGYTTDDIKKLDDEEYASRNIKEEETYFAQDIQACLQRAEIYINNEDSPRRTEFFHELANQLIKFVSLIQHPGLVTPTAIERCMQLAYTAKLNSGCISRQVGAAITDTNFAIKAIGWNDTPQGQVPCILRSREQLLSGKDKFAYSEYESTNKDYIAFFNDHQDKYIPIVEDGLNISYCFSTEYNTLQAIKNGIQDYKYEKNQVHTRSLHAEENAFLQLSKYGGQGIEGGFLFTTASPCELCGKKAYQLGITKIYYIDPYPGISMSHVLAVGKKNPKLILFSGAIGKAFHKLYTPTIPYKDELAARAK